MGIESVHFVIAGMHTAPADVVGTVIGVMLIVAALIPAALWMRARIEKTERLKRGQCLQCGYDLRGSTKSCPECGADR